VKGADGSELADYGGFLKFPLLQVGKKSSNQKSVAFLDGGDSFFYCEGCELSQVVAIGQKRVGGNVPGSLKMLQEQLDLSLHTR